MVTTAGQGALAARRDALAPHWERIFGAGGSAAAVRERYLTEATNKFGPGAWILHLGCGTGADTVELARQGIRVWALDWSPVMVDQTRALIQRAGLERNASAHLLAPQDALALLDHGLTPERLDGCFAPWGALNQTEDLPGLFGALYQLLRPSGLLIAGMLNPRSLFGALGAIADGHLKEGVQRLRGQGADRAEWSLGGDLPPLPVAFPTPEDLKEIFGTRFKLERSEPIGMVTPPAGLGRLAGRGRGLLPALGKLERVLAPLPPARRLADQNLVVIRRTIEGLWGPAGPHYLAN